MVTQSYVAQPLHAYHHADQERVVLSGAVGLWDMCACDLNGVGSGYGYGTYYQLWSGAW